MLKHFDMEAEGHAFLENERELERLTMLFAARAGAVEHDQCSHQFVCLASMCLLTFGFVRSRPWCFSDSSVSVGRFPVVAYAHKVH